jgi:hypothetical protein
MNPLMQISEVSVNGRNPAQLNAKTLMRLTPQLPIDWTHEAERRLLCLRKSDLEHDRHAGATRVATGQATPANRLRPGGGAGLRRANNPYTAGLTTILRLFR